MELLQRFWVKHWELIVIFFVALTPLLWFRGGEILLGHDANFRMNHVSHMISSMYSWNDTSYYGNDWTYDRGYLPVNLLQWLFLTVTPSFSSMQTMFFISMFLLLGFSSYICVRSIFPESKYSAFRILASLFSMFNFFILKGWFTGDTGRFLVFAGLPLYILVVHKVFTGTWTYGKSLVVFALLSFFFNGDGLPPLVGFQAIAVVLVGLYYTLFRVRQYGWAGLWFSLKTALLFAVLFIGINAYWLAPIIVNTSASYASDYSAFGGPEGTLAWEGMISKFASFVNLFRLQGIADWYENANHAYAGPYLTHPLLILLSFVPAVVVILGFFTKRIQTLQKEKRRFLIGIALLLLFGLFMSAGTHSPFGRVYELFMRYIPGFVIFRSSLYKFGFALWIPMILLFSFFAGEFLHAAVKHKALRLIALVIIGSGIIGFHYPYFSPEKVFHFSSDFTTRLSLPSHVTDMLSYIDTTVPASSRILLLPDLDREYIGIPVDAYTWGYYSLILLPNLISDRTYIADKESDTVIQMIYNSIYSSDVPMFERLTSKAGISYILFRSDIQLSPGSKKLHPIADVERALESIPSVSLVKEFGNWQLYKITTSKDIAMVNALHTYDIILPPTTNSTYLMARDINDTHGVVQVYSEDATPVIREGAEKQIIEAECYLCKRDEYMQLVEAIVLPTKKALPEFITRRTSALQEKQDLSNTEHMPKERIDVDLSLSQHELAVAVRALQTGTPFPQTFFERYPRFINDSMERFSGLTGRDRNVYAIRIKAYFESQSRILRTYKELQREEQLLRDYLKVLEKEAWYTTDVSRLRFGFTIPAAGTYRFYLPYANSYSNQVLVDGVNTGIDKQMYLKEGFHTVELHKILMDTTAFAGPPALFVEQELHGTKAEMPQLTYSRIQSTEYRIHVSDVAKPYVLQLNQLYDPRWEAYVKKEDSSLVPQGSHVKVNGYANGWYVTDLGDYDIVLSYAPQHIFLYGLYVSGLSIVCIVVVAVYSNSRKTRRKKEVT